MTRLLSRVGAVLPLVVLVIGLALVTDVDAAGSTTGPVVTLNDTTVAAGDRIMVTVTGFSAPTVTISVCGNEARRGSGDCNMVKSKGVRIDPAVDPTVTKFGVSAPPVGCPCIIRVSSLNGDEVAIAPITLTGHPIEPVVSAPNVDSPFVVVAIDARPAPRGAFGWMRSNLGGPFRYEVTVTVRNIAAEPLHYAKVSGSVGRKQNESLATLVLDDPGEIGIGQTWTQTVAVVVPAPSFGALTWRASVSGAGPTVDAHAATRHRPTLLIVLLMLIVVDVALLAMRFAVRRRLARDAARAESATIAGNIEDAIDATSSDADDPGSESHRRELESSRG